MTKEKAKAKRGVEKTKPCSDGRNGKGQFAQGNKGGVGHSHKASELGRSLKAALAASVSPQDIKDIGAALLKKALTGDVPATKELFDRLWGKAPQAVTGPDGGPLQMQIIDYSSLHPKE